MRATLASATPRNHHFFHGSHSARAPLHREAFATAAHTSQRRISPTPVSCMALRNTWSASIRSTEESSLVRYVGEPLPIRPSWINAAGRCRPDFGTNHVRSFGTDVRSVVKGTAGSGTMMVRTRSVPRLSSS